MTIPEVVLPLSDRILQWRAEDDTWRSLASREDEADTDFQPWTADTGVLIRADGSFHQGITLRGRATLSSASLTPSPKGGSRRRLSRKIEASLSARTSIIRPGIASSAAQSPRLRRYLKPSGTAYSTRQQ